MNELRRGPIREHWTIHIGQTTHGGATPTTLAEELGVWEVNDLEAFRPEIYAALAQLSTAGGVRALCGPGDPVVVMLQALGVLCRSHPYVTSRVAAQLIGQLTGRSESGLDLTVAPPAVAKGTAPQSRASGPRKDWVERPEPRRTRPTPA